MHKSNNHILPSHLVSMPRSWAAAACQHLLISKPTQSHFFGSTHWCTWQRERHCCFINSFMLAQLDPVQGFHSIVTMHFSLFPLLLHHVPLKRADACLPPSCSCSSMSPCSRHHSSSCVLPHALWQSPSTARTAALHGTKSLGPLGSLSLGASSLWEVWPRHSTGYLEQN